VTYAGPAPNFVAGMSEVQFEISGYSGPIVLSLPPIDVSLPSPTSQGFMVYVAAQ
jgi:hypothetical protein